MGKEKVTTENEQKERWWGQILNPLELGAIILAQISCTVRAVQLPPDWCLSSVRIVLYCTFYIDRVH
jgi:hypothetical protein